MILSHASEAGSPKKRLRLRAATRHGAVKVELNSYFFNILEATILAVKLIGGYPNRKNTPVQ